MHQCSHRPGIWWMMAILGIMSCNNSPEPQPSQLKFYAADDSSIQYTVRIDMSNPQLPRFWQPGVYIIAMFEGDTCQVILRDEELWGTKHNYVHLQLDDQEMRVQMRSSQDTFLLVADKPAISHKLIIAKNTEANNGYLELVGIRCRKLLAPPARPTRKMEFIGNSITCGAGADTSGIPCGKGQWEDQHNAWASYGSITARSLNASFHLSAVSGIGLMHSCCNLDILMPQVFDKVSMRDNRITWDFAKYQPDVVTVCLGHNDGIQDSTEFCNRYIGFLQQIRKHYPAATIVCLSSPMADERLNAILQAYLTAIVRKVTKSDSSVHSFFYSKRYYRGCDTHPDLAEHREMAKELSGFIRKVMNW